MTKFTKSFAAAAAIATVGSAAFAYETYEDFDPLVTGDIVQARTDMSLDNDSVVENDEIIMAFISKFDTNANGRIEASERTMADELLGEGTE